MVKVGTDDDIFLLERGVTPREETHDVLRFRLRARHGNPGMDRHGERKVGQRLIRIQGCQDLLKGVTASREEEFRVRCVEEDANGEGRGDALARIAQFHPWLEPGCGHPRPGHLSAFWILDGDGADDSGFLKRFAALFTGLVMRFYRSGHVCRAADQENYHFALPVLTPQMVVLQL